MPSVPRLASVVSAGSSNNGLQEVELLRVDASRRSAMLDHVVEECAIALVYNGFSYAVMMATPTDLEDFAIGFSLSEGLVDRADELSVLSIRTHDHAVIVEMAVAESRFHSIQARARRWLGSSACGLCGSESLQAALPIVPHVAPGNRVRLGDITQALDHLAEQQVMNRASGGVHAAAWVHASTLCVREDVGRHNALDKLIGARARLRLPAGWLLLSSRASYELVHKAAVANIALVVVISAPTSMAIRVAELAGITLIGFARGERLNVYSHAHRLID